jgi:hypothetical protein
LWLLAFLPANIGNSQGTIISVSGPPDTTSQWGGGLAVGGYPEGVSWIATSAFQNVIISISLAGDPGATGMAYLTTKVGAGTTAANAIASASFAFPSTSSLVPVLSDLNLGAGTYYLIIQQTANDSNGRGLWNGTASPSIISAPGVVANGEYSYFNSVQGYPPAAPFSVRSATHYDYEVTSSAVPEPPAALYILISTSILILGTLRNRVRS